ncbi:MAG: 8-oxo-dGTP diphosphatase MutT [Pseudomonadales bacterium]
MNDQPKQRFVRVAVGVIVRNGQICISLRPDHLHKGGCWEFPGGKIDEGETVESALARELGEELGIEVISTSPIIDIDWAYPEKNVRLEVLQVNEFIGEPRGLENQQVRWIPVGDLIEYQFPEANRAIVEALLS